jgi:hypothetical protein
MIVRFHALTENQPINQAWDERPVPVSDKFSTLGVGLSSIPFGRRWPFGSAS